MMTWLTMGFRNLVKNARRSMITAFAIGVAFATVALFDGFATYMHRGNQSVAVYMMAQGHLVVFKAGFLERGRLDLGRYLLSAEEINTITARCAELPEVELSAPQLHISGLLSDGRVSTIFLAQGVQPSVRDVFAQHLERIAVNPDAVKSRMQGLPLRDDRPDGVAVAQDLAGMLGLGLGDHAMAMTTTVDGRMNAMDLEIFLTFRAGSDQLNDKFMIVPFQLAQELYDTDGADRVAILLHDTEQTLAVRDRLLEDFAAAGLDLDIYTWDELSEWYLKVKGMFDTIFQFLFVIVFIIVVMSVVNTMGMAVMERTREIGTLRSMGLRRRGVIQLFAVESLLLGVLGSLLGTLLASGGWLFVKLIKPTWTPPGMSNEFVIWIEWVPRTMGIAFVFMLLLCLIASLIPARRAARQNIVDALGHV